ncbi:MAG TPA: hypothetical protein VF283_15935 [Bryobacteraceae bacterium]
MATPKQIAANRRNAEKSTGPKSVETKAKVAQNGVKHGLCAKFRVLEEVEKQENYDAFLNQLIEDEQPVGQAEIELVVKMAEHTWLAKRALRMQNHCFSPVPKTPEQVKNGGIPVAVVVSDLERYVRYHAAHDRAYQRASAELQKRKKTRQLAEIGFASQKRAEAEESRKAEKHAVQIATAKLRKQREEMKLGDALAKMLPPDFDLSSLDQLFSAPMHRGVAEAA